MKSILNFKHIGQSSAETAHENNGNSNPFIPIIGKKPLKFDKFAKRFVVVFPLTLAGIALGISHPFLFLLTSVGAAFSCFLFSLAKEFRIVEGFAAILVGSIIGIGMYIFIALQNPRPYYRYVYEVTFLDGEKLIFTGKSFDDPHVCSYKGSYWVECGENHHTAAIRTRIISKSETQYDEDF